MSILRYIALIFVFVLLIILIFGYRKREDSALSTYFHTLVTIVLGLPTLLAIIFPEKISTIINPDIQEYIKESWVLNASYDELEKSYKELDKSYDNLLNSYNVLQSDYEKVDKEKEELETNQVDFRYKNVSLVVGGLEKQNKYNSGVVIVDNKVFYSQQIVADVSGDSIYYDDNSNKVFWGNEKKITKYDFQNVSDILYNGIVYWKYDNSTNESFAVSGDSYRSGFVIGCDHSILGEGDGYALFKLDNKYTKMEFDVGKTDDYEIQDVDLLVYLDGEIQDEEYHLLGEASSKHIVISVNNATDLKIQLTGGSRVKYGFYNVIFHQ